MTLKLVGLYGESRAGKNEVGNILVRDFGFELRAQADAIREILLGMDPDIQDNKGTFYTMQHLFEACEEDWDVVKARSYAATEYMIRLGKTCRKVLGMDIWLNTVFPQIGDTTKIVVPDIRQKNEYDAVKERGGEVWRVTRPSVTEKRGMDGLLDDLSWDAHIDNRGSLLDLRGIVQATIATNMRNKEVRKNVGIRF